jgi:lipoprotein-releasing system permease protein
MFSVFERMVAFRYLRPQRQEGFISVIAGFSLLGIALGVATLIIVMSVMNGFRAEFLKEILGFNGAVTVYGNRGGMTDGDRLAAAIAKLPGVTEALPLVDGQAVASVTGNWTGVQVRGQRQADLLRQADIAGHIVGGDLHALDDDGIVIGYRLAVSLGLQVGSQLTLLSPEGVQTAFGTVPRVKTFTVAALFNTGMYQYDSSYVYVTFGAAQRFFHVPDGANSIQVFVDDPTAVPDLLPAVRQVVGDEARVYDWQGANSPFLNAVTTERNVMFLILTLIVIVAAFNVISSMIMLVRAKGRDIAILRTMGATQGMVLRIFFLTGASVGVVGTVLGVALGLAFAENIEAIRQFLQRFTGNDLFSAEIYFLSQLPAKVEPVEVTGIVLMAFAVSFLATIYPAWRAARLDPVEALRYE